MSTYTREYGTCPVCDRTDLALNDAGRVWRHDPAHRLMKLVSCAGSWRPAKDRHPMQLELPAQRLGRMVAEAEQPELFAA
jgi:hypothetical protein